MTTHMTQKHSLLLMALLQLISCEEVQFTQSVNAKTY